MVAMHVECRTQKQQCNQGTKSKTFKRKLYLMSESSLYDNMIHKYRSKIKKATELMKVGFLHKS